ncbi:MAG: nuclear transport factor 2 family protein [Polyangiales bacterium]
MSIAHTRETFDQYKRAAESGDERALLSLYADDAEIVDVNKRNPPSKPDRHRGRTSILDWLSQVPKDLKHTISDEVIGEDRMAFSYRCRYPTGQEVFGVHVCEVKDGKIKREVIAESWDD